MRITLKTSIFATALLALTGCMSKPVDYTVKVSPTGFAMPANNPNAVNSDATYDGESLVNNSPQIQQQAAKLANVVYFAFDSDTISEQAAAVIDQQIAFLNNNKEAKVLIAGHTDERGSREYNLSLGERRAVAVRQYLVDKGVNLDNVQIGSFGEEKPAATGSNEEAWSQNRRAEFIY